MLGDHPPLRPFWKGLDLKQPGEKLRLRGQGTKHHADGDAMRTTRRTPPRR